MKQGRLTMIGQRDYFAVSKVSEWLCVTIPVLIGLIVIIYLLPNGSARLLSAARHGRLQNVQKLVLEKKIDVDSRNSSGNTPLMLAAAAGYMDIVEFLVQHGASLNGTNVDGQTALMLAALGNRITIVKYLSDSGANANISDKAGLNVLSIAKTNVGIARSLVK